MKKCKENIVRYESSLKNIASYEDENEILSDLADDIIQGKVVLLLGHQTLLDIPVLQEESPEEHRFLASCKGDLNAWMFNNYKRLRSNLNLPLNDAVTDFDISKYNMHQEDVKEILTHFVKKCDTPYRLLRNNADFLSLETNDLNPLIITLLKKKYIRVVLTTVYDDTVEKLMREIWGDQLKVLNFKSPLVEHKEIQNLSQIFLESEMPPVLYYLFGNAVENGVSGKPEFVALEEDKINIIKDWIRTPSKFLKDYVLKTRKISDNEAAYERRILAVGCKFEDWLFRFFWCGALQQKFGHVIDNNLVTMSIDDSNPNDLNLRDFIERQSLTNIEDASAFLKALNERLETAEKDFILKTRKKGGVFLSYCSDYAPIVRSLYYSLLSNGVEAVWFDEKKLSVGDSYKDDIKQAISQCSVFVPVLGRKMAEHPLALDEYDDKSEGYKFYRDFEWRVAKERIISEESNPEVGERKMAIMPFSLPDYNPKAVPFSNEIKEKYDCIFGKTVAQYSDRMGFTILVDKIKRHLNS